MIAPVHTHRLYFKLLRFSPFLMATLMLIYAVLFALGLRSQLIETLADAGVVAAVLLFVTSKVVGMCKLHRALIVYAAAVSLCIDFNQYFDFGEQLRIVLFLSIGTGLLIIPLSLIKRFCVQ